MWAPFSAIFLSNIAEAEAKSKLRSPVIPPHHTVIANAKCKMQNRRETARCCFVSEGLVRGAVLYPEVDKAGQIPKWHGLHLLCYSDNRHGLPMRAGYAPYTAAKPRVACLCATRRWERCRTSSEACHNLVTRIARKTPPVLGLFRLDFAFCNLQKKYKHVETQ